MRRIVVIEEDKALRRVLKAIIAREGYKSLRVRRMNEAIQTINLAVIKDGDCGVLIDMNTVNLLRDIRALWPNLQVIALTSFAESPNTAVDLMALVDGVLEKPFSLRAITGMMRFVFTEDAVNAQPGQTMKASMN